MRDDDEPTPDSDRAAILARRKQFIAFALSGLATTACTGSGEPEPKQTPPERESSAQPCLAVEILPPEQQNVPPQPCLEIIKQPPPERETGEAPVGETGEPQAGETGEPEVEEPPPTPPPKDKPRPCLRKAPPSPCLKFNKLDDL
jgi:hypothetical protein